jgi:Polyketide cyclase / dehydrase and lipid transport
MRTVNALQTVAGSVQEVERRWYDTSRWPSWVDGLEHIVELTGDWPAAGASVTWESGPAGRGRVVERVVEHQPLAGQTLEVSDASIRGRQTVAFAALDVGVEVALTLAYQLQRRSPLTAVVDALFIRRAMTASLSTTLGRFASELAASGPRLTPDVR